MPDPSLLVSLIPTLIGVRLRISRPRIVGARDTVVCRRPRMCDNSYALEYKCRGLQVAVVKEDELAESYDCHNQWRRHTEQHERLHWFPFPMYSSSAHSAIVKASKARVSRAFC